MWTPGAVDFFRILNEQTGVVAEVNRDALLLRVAQVGRGGAGQGGWAGGGAGAGRGGAGRGGAGRGGAGRGCLLIRGAELLMDW